MRGLPRALGGPGVVCAGWPRSRADAAEVMGSGVGGEQMSLDFSASSAQRQRRAAKAIERAERRPLALFAEPPNIDVHLHSPTEAVATISGDPDRAVHFLQSMVGQVRIIKSRRVAFPAERLDRLAWVRPPVQVTLDAASLAVVRAVWAQKLGWRPLRVTRQGRRLVASSVRWPRGMRVVDAPWTTIAVLTRLGVEFEVDPRARSLLLDSLGRAGAAIAEAGLAGSAVVLRTSRPELLEGLGLPGLSYAAESGAGLYRMPLLSAECLLDMPVVALSKDVEAAIRRVSGRVRPLKPGEGFPWTLYPFQARDAGQADRILETTGGVLLAGEMGSGKTTVSLALIHERDLWPLLVVSPLSAFSTWARQLGEMGRSFYLATDPPKVAWERLSQEHFDAVVMSFDRLHAFSELVESLGFRAIIADEVQRIRTPGSRRSRALRALAGSVPVRIGLSGTPLTNSVADLLPLGAFLVPGEWRPRANSKDLADMYPGDSTEAIAEHLGSMMVRRRMVDTGAVLPQRNDHRVFIELTPEQRRALRELEEEAQRAKEEGAFDDNSGRMHAFARLQLMRQIVNCPSAAGVGGPNPKVRAAVDLVEDFLAMGRKGVVFCADRTTFRELGEALDAIGVGWVGIWGSTPPAQRIENERRFHTDPDVKVVLCTIQAGSESWSASPSATWLISTSYMYAPSLLAQMEARVYRMNSDPDGPEIEIMYLHAQVPGGSLDDRMVEILAVKQQLFAQVVDRDAHVDQTKVHYSMGDLVFLLTGERDEALDARVADAKAASDREVAAREHAKSTLYRNKGKNRLDAGLERDSGEQTLTWEEFAALDEVDEMLDADSDVVSGFDDEVGFDVLDGDD